MLKRMGLIVGALLLLGGCEDTREGRDSGPPADAGGSRDSGGVIILMDSGGPGGLPAYATGLGTLAPDCVQFCRDLFTSCGSRVEVCFSDGGGGCSPRETTPTSCAMQCADAPAYRAALGAAGCTDQYLAYQTCVANAAAAATCSVFDAECGIEWGVYASCAGL